MDCGELPLTTLLTNREIYERVVCGIVPQARERLWIATADIKDMYVEPPTRATEARRDWRDDAGNGRAVRPEREVPAFA